MNELDSKGTSPQSQTPRCLQFVVLGFVCLALIFHFGMAAKGMSDYRGQHLGTALEYAKGKINLLRPVIVGFNAAGTPTALEIPFWQATAAVFFKCLGPWFGWANLTSLLYIIASFWPVFQLAKQALGTRGAWWALVFYIAQPLIFWEGGHGGTDGSSLTFTLWFVFFADRLVQSGQVKWFIPAVLFGILSATSKAPFFLCAGLASFFLLLVKFRTSLRRWVLLSSVGLAATGTFLCWTHYTDKLLTQAEFPFVDLRIVGFWYFGDLAYRLNPHVWAKAIWHFLTGEFGSLALVGLAVAGFFPLRSTLIRAWLLASAITVLIFTHLILHHDHYYLMLSPAIAILCAAAFQQLENVLVANWPKLARWIPPAAAALLALALVQGLAGLKIVLLATDPYPKRMARTIQEHTAPTDKILIQGGDWGGQELFLADRTGLSIWDTDIAKDPKNLNRLRELGYTKLVMISESPLLTSLHWVNPGGESLPRITYRAALTPAAEPWPTVFQTEDILIKDIPKQ